MEKKNEDQKKDIKKKAELVRGFSEELRKSYSSLIKAVWFVPDGVQAVMFLIDDTKSMDITAIDRMKADAGGLARNFTAEKGVKLHTIFYNLTDYWELVRHGSPVTFMEIRDGIPLFDPTGFFVPIKKLLQQGRIPGTKEAMKSLLEEAPLKLLRIERFHMNRIVNELAFAVIDAGQAPLLLVGVAPPTARELGEKMKIHLVEKGLLEAEYLRYYEEVFGYMKAVEHGEIKKISPEDLERLLDRAGKFVKRMGELMQKLGRSQTF